MSCSPFDLRDFFLKELADPQQRQVEAHVRNCAPCREELDRLRITEAALFSLRDEEIPQRVAFVSDPIFEPSPWRRWLASFWGSGARLGFASAAMLSTALIVFALHRPAVAPPIVQIAPAGVAQIATVAASDVDIQARIDAAVAKAVGQVQVRQAAETRRLISDLHDARASLLLAKQEYDYEQKRFGTSRILAGAQPPPDRTQGDLR
jgi:hypothetical protein